MYRLLLLPLLLGCRPTADSGKDSATDDADGDGFTGIADCAPDDGAIHPDAPEVCDEVDNNCDGDVDEGVVLAFYADADGDGFGDKSASTTGCTAPSGYVELGNDCDDTDGAVNPGAVEVCDELDNNCDNVVDEGMLLTFYADSDGDGYGNDAYTYEACAAPAGYAAAGGDCDDGDDSTYPTAPEPDCTDPIDHNCDGSVGYDDLDGDGYAACEDCDDRDDHANPGELEICDEANADEDCDGVADDADSSATGQTYAWRDADGDGHGDAAESLYVCDVPAGAAANSDDCDDSSPIAFPGAIELCNDADDDCDGVVDDGVLLTVYIDEDGDGYGVDAYSMEACEVPSGYALMGGDCDDTDPAYNPGAAEADCNDPADYNCDGSVGFVDGDGDGWAACADCDDDDATVNPDQVEICGGGDEDCNGDVDDADAGVTDQLTLYADADGDGYGTSVSTEACAVSDGWTTTPGDCDDSAATTYPSAGEACDSVDNDCDGVVDDGASDASVWYLDFDGDGHGGSTVSYVGCSPPSGYVNTSDDCDDGDEDAFPGNTETCDAVDNDCDGSVDDGVAPDWYQDLDGDGYGTDTTLIHDCTRPAGYSAEGGDCDDAHDDAYPGATEVCDTYDNDCDRQIDDSDFDLDTSTGTDFHPDLDHDTYGDEDSSVLRCKAPIGWVADGTDCNDTAATIHPDLIDNCDGIDSDCDGSVDDDGVDTVYPDLDGDGDGDRRSESYIGCDDADASVTATDCDDTDPAVTACAFYPFDGTTGTAWETLSAPGTVNNLAVYVPLGSDYGMYTFYGSKVYGYDSDAHSWHTFTTANPLSSAYYASVAPVDDRFYSIRYNGIRYFDPALDSFTTASSYSMSESYPMTESDEDGVVYGYNNNTLAIIAYDTTTGTTTTKSTSRSMSYARLAYDPDSRRIFYGTYSQTNLYWYDLDDGTSGTTSSMTEWLSMAVCSDRAGHIYVGGYNSSTGSDVTVNQYTVATDTWSRIPDTPTSTGLTGSCGVSEDGYLYITSGSTTVYRIALY